MLTAATLGLAGYGLYSTVYGLVDLFRPESLEVWADLTLVVFGLVLAMSAPLVRVAIPGGLALAIGTLLGLEAIAIHNVPEGLAVALPLRARGAGFLRCFTAAFLTSLPQPLTAVPAALLVWFFQPLLLPLLGFAAGAMMFLVLMELIPDALDDRRPVEIAWSFLFGFCLMILVQVII